MYKSIYKESNLKQSNSVISIVYKKSLSDFEIRQPFLSSEEINIRKLVLNKIKDMVEKIDLLIPEDFGRGIKNSLFCHTTSDSNYSLIEQSNTLNSGWVYPQIIVKELLCHKELKEFINNNQIDSKLPNINPFLANRFFFQSENILNQNRVIICNIPYYCISSKKSINGNQIIKPISLNELRVLKFNESKNTIFLIKP